MADTLDASRPQADASIDDDAVIDAILERLMAGPVTVDELAGQLIEIGVVPTDADRADIASLIDEVVLDTPGFWMHDGAVARIDRLLEGRILTHRLTLHDLRLGGIAAEPDLSVMGSAPDTDLLVGSGQLAVVQDDAVDWLGYVGPTGWLDGYEVGELVGLRFSNGRWSLERVLEPGDGSAEVAAVLAQLAPALDAGAGDELIGPVLNALLGDHSLFSRPQPPMGELLTSAGLTTDGVRFGPADRVWYARGASPELATRGVADRHDVNGCCLTALYRSAQRWRAHVLGLTDLPAVPSAAEVARAMDHGGVPSALVDLLPLPRGADRVAAFVDELREVSPDTAGILALAGAVADRLGRHKEAEDWYRQAEAVDPSNQAAVTGLAWQAFDRGDVVTASRLLRRVVKPGHRHLRLVEDLSRVLPPPGRNTPCPCGSGRKYKACHLGQAVVSPRARPQLIMTKLARFAGTNHTLSTLRLQMQMAGLDPDDETIRRAAFGLKLFDPDTLAPYRSARGDLLPDDERQLVDQIIGTPVRLAEVTEAQAGGPVTFHDLTTDESVTCLPPPHQQLLSVGSVGLVRIVGEQVVGAFDAVPNPENQAMIRSLLADPPGGPRQLIHLLSALAPA